MTLAKRNVASRSALIEEDYHGGTNCGGDVHRPGVVRNEKRQPSERRRKLSDRQSIENDRVLRESTAHFLYELSLFRAGEQNNSHFIVSHEFIGKLGKILKRPSSARMAGAGKYPHQRNARIGLLLRQQPLDSFVVFDSSAELRSTRRILYPQGLQHVEVPVHRMLVRAGVLNRRLRSKIREKI